MKKIIVFAFLSLFFINSTFSQSFSFQKEIDSIIESDTTIPGILLHVEAPDLGISWSGAAGVSNIQTKDELLPLATARIASNTKTYVAAAILRLWEQELIDLQQPISHFISKKHNDLLESDGYDTNEITVYHLLTHTSGIFDHAASNNYISKVFQNPNYQWTRSEQLEGSVNWGDPLFDPGKKFSYSDTGYILLGEIIEKVTNKPLGDAVSDALGFTRLGLKSTWWEKVQTKPETASKRMHQYFQGMDTYSFDPSLDLYGGGGLVASTRDMALFYQLLFNNEVFQNTSTLSVMTNEVEFPDDYQPSNDYRLGLFHYTLEGLEVYSHTGFWSTQAAYIPELNASVGIIITQFGKVRYMNELFVKVIKELTEISKKE